VNKRVVVITGATGALGNLAARAFAERGHSLALLDHNQEKLDSLVRDLNLPSERLYTSVMRSATWPRARSRNAATRWHCSITTRKNWTPSSAT